MGSSDGRRRLDPVPRWRTATRFLMASLDLRAAGFALALLAVTVGASVTSTALSLRADLGPKMTRELRAFGPNLLVGPAGDARGLDETWVERIERSGDRPAVISPFLIGGGTVDQAPAVLMGVDFSRARALAPSWRIEGSWPEGPDSCLLGAVVAEAAKAAPGDPVTVRIAGGEERRLTVAGIAHTGEAEDEQAIVLLDWLQRASAQPGRISGVAVAVEGGPDDVARLAAALERSGDVEARPLRQVSAAQGALLAKLDRMMFLLTGVVLLLAGMCVMTTLLSIVVERAPEIGLMRSMGASDGEVLRMLLGEATLLGLAGGMLGLGVGALDVRWIGRQVFGTAATMRLGVAPWVLGVTLALCWLAVLLPLRRALRIQPAAALRGE